MNIKQAKEQVKNAVTAYLSRDEDGEYRIPANQQRPIFLVGAPGIGKTAIVEQVAIEMGVGLISYSITHHTRQSALGLPFIEHKTYAGQSFDVSNYTMSEIIASVYEMMEKTGVKEGILFLDEINCVSETLSPIMLQFLQYKVFGAHHVPEGWIIVTAGNPPEFNTSVHEMDVVTLDRLKRIDVEYDLRAWKEYALQVDVHPAILTYLENQPGDFYHMESIPSGKSFVTPRGWVDLSRMLRVYEAENLPVSVDLIGQYLQNTRIALEFAQYYDLFRKYSEDYHVESILAGKAPQTIKDRAAKAKFDERLALSGLILDALSQHATNVMTRFDMLTRLTDVLRDFRMSMARPHPGVTLSSLFHKIIETQREALKAGAGSNSMSAGDQRVARRLIACMERQAPLLRNVEDPRQAFDILLKDHDVLLTEARNQATVVQSYMDHAFDFADLVWPQGNEALVIATELTARPDCARFIARIGCQAYFRHNKDLLLYERQGELQSLVNELKLN